MKKFLTYEEFGELTSMNPNTIKWLVYRGKIPSIKLGRRRLIPASFLEEMEGQAWKSIKKKKPAAATAGK